MKHTNTTTATTLKVGQSVKWISGASGVKKTKKGEIVAMIAAGKTLPKTKFPMFANKAPRNFTSYVIDVKGKLYFPYPSKLQKI